MNNKYYDSEEKFEIDLDKAYMVDDLHYHGVKTRYLKDTNTIIFSKDYETDEDDLDTIVYRNYNIDNIKQHIDFNFKKKMYDELEPMYSGYPTEDNYRKNLISNINKTKLQNMKEVSSKLKYALSPYDLIRIAREYKKDNKDFKDKAEYLLTDLNFHTECSLLTENETDELTTKSKKEINKIAEHYVLDKFITEYKANSNNQGYIANTSEELDDVSLYDLRYLQYEGYIRPTLNGYELTDNYIKELNSNTKKYKYVHWLKIDLTNETKDGKEWLNLKRYKEKYDCNMTVFYYNNSFIDKAVKLECNQKYEDLDLDVNSMSSGSLIRLKSKPKNITVYKKDIDDFFADKIKIKEDSNLEL